eukprot:CAMPEP_0182912956 /NCGR_PEP_ID=MMETSP0034_2-20130328/37788_1 /TAXON_ID=156128 /ORGANISM="Nephroselmis pyriformis, Strain CCMP717" /LENGTH=73 /DNA_ID=CAMNT_0025049653 /DNA_START=131 /DNA_END=348 /DNA_ORIENTATION=+
MGVRQMGHRRSRLEHLRHMLAWPQGMATTLMGADMHITHSIPAVELRWRGRGAGASASAAAASDTHASSSSSP